MTSIGTGAFYGCTGLTSISIPDNVTSIGFGAFRGCVDLTSITIPNSVTSIGNSAFFGCTGLTSITVNTDNEEYTSKDGVLFDKSLMDLIQYPIGNNRTQYTVPNSVTSIEDWTFSGCTDLRDVTIPTTVTSIGDSAFSGCTGLRYITIPNSVTSIGFRSFSGCEDLTIMGFMGSYAETFAKEHDIPFEVIRQETVTGDYNGDSEVSVADAVLLARFVVEDTALTAEQIAGILNHVPDYDGDGLVTIMDITALLEKLGEG